MGNSSARYGVRAVVAAGAIGAMLVVGMVGCTEEVRSPEQVFDSFLNQLRGGQQQQALEEVWPPTQEEVEEAHAGLARYFSEEPPLEPAELLVVTRVANPMAISRVRLKETVPESPEDGEVVELALEFRDDRSATAPVRWSQQQGRWFVDLPMQTRRPLDIEGGDGGNGVDDGDQPDHDRMPRLQDEANDSEEAK